MLMKSQKIPVQDTDFFAWEYQEQTKIKHRVLQGYYRIYASKLGSNGNTLFIDCHGGCGAYIKDKSLTFGSSILVDEVALPIFANRIGTQNRIIVCESDKENFENLVKVINWVYPLTSILRFPQGYWLK